jgi:hypothetical protein
VDERKAAAATISPPGRAAPEAGAKHVAEVTKALHQRSDEPAVVLARVDRPADMEAVIRSHVYKPDCKKLVTPQQLLVGVADGSRTSPQTSRGRTDRCGPGWDD